MNPPASTDLLKRFPALKTALTSRWPQLLVRLVALAGFLLAILAGLSGTPVGSRNLGIVLVWIGWWAALMLLAVPVFGRGWCSVCPIPLPGEWLQNGSLLAPHSKGLGLGRRWPKALRNIWLQNAGFALLALFSTAILTQPRISALVLAGMLLLAVAASLAFERRAFCRYLCPVGGFIGLYSQMAPLELRVVDTAVCAGHKEKSCYTGSQDGYGCPWGVFPGGLVKNNTCGLCMECLRTCPHENIAINLRPAGSDLELPRGRRLDEAFKAFLMLGSAIVYALILLGPFGALKNAAASVGSLSWLGYALAFLAFVFGVVPGVFTLAVIAGRKLGGATASLRKELTSFAYALAPLGLAAWMAFSLGFVFANLSYLPAALSDPLSKGWDLLGTAGIPWTPWLTGLTPLLQAGVLLVGLAWANRTALRISRETTPHALAVRKALPVSLYCLLAAVALLVLMVA